MIRRFTHKESFDDDTDYIKVNVNNGSIEIISKDGTSIPARHYSLSDCLRYVEQGEWVELKPESEDKMSCECKINCEKLKESTAKAVEFGFLTEEGRQETIEKCCKTVSIDFSTAQVGDKVRCLLNGDGEVIVSAGGRYPVAVKFGSGFGEEYMADGKRYPENKNPCLIAWVDSDGNLCRTRPEPGIDWSKVEIDAPVKITRRNSGKTEVLYFNTIDDHNNPQFFSGGRTSISKRGLYDVESFTDSYATFKLIKKGE